MFTANVALIAQMARAFGMNPKFESPSGRDIFCLKNFDIFTRTPVRVSKMNAVARAQLTFQTNVNISNVNVTLSIYIYMYIYI